MIFGKGERGCTLRTTAFFIKALKYRRFGNVRITNCWHKHACYDFGRKKGVKCE